MDVHIPANCIILITFYLAFGEVKGCKVMSYKGALQNKALINHVIKTLKASGEDDCEFRCYLEDHCISYSFGTSASGEKSMCELSDSDHFMHPGDLVERVGVIYKSAENACKSKPCPSNITCQPNFHTQSFSCLCPTGFSGLNCSDIDECSTGVHNCSVGSSCVNTNGSFECRCIEGYEKRENKCIKILGEYSITVYTGNESGAGTDADVYIQLYGTHFDKETITSKKKLQGQFESDSVDVTRISGIPNMETMSKITISHDNTGWLAAWYLNKVIVDNKTQQRKYTFQCNCWISSGDSYALSRDLQPT